MKNLVTRSLAGIVYVAVILTAILADPTGIYLLGILFSILAAIEFQNLCCGTAYGSIEFTDKYLAVLGTLGAFSLTATPTTLFGVAEYCGPDTEFAYIVFTFIAAMAVVGIMTMALRFLLTLYEKNDHALQNFAYSAMSWLYIGVPLGCLCLIGRMSLGSQILLMLFIMIWLNDTGAYCVGSLLGKHKLFERLSPKKSWEGFWGGMAFSIIAGVVYGIVSYTAYRSLPSTVYAEEIFSKTAYMAVWGGIGAVISVAATWGDLFESLIKRTLGVKDSGHMIPGHGGILDRIDSLLFAAPAMLAICMYVFG